MSQDAEHWIDVATKVLGHGSDGDRARSMVHLEDALLEGSQLDVVCRDALAFLAHERDTSIDAQTFLTESEAFHEQAEKTLHGLMTAAESSEATRFLAGLATSLLHHAPEVLVQAILLALDVDDEPSASADAGEDDFRLAFAVARNEGHPMLHADELLYLAAQYAAATADDQASRMQAMALGIEEPLLRAVEKRLVELVLSPPEPKRKEGYQRLAKAFAKEGRMLLVAATGAGEFINRPFEENALLARCFEGDAEALADYVGLLAVNGLAHEAARLRVAAATLSQSPPLED